MTAFVIAARGSDTVVAGIPLLLRAVLSAQRAGIADVRVVCEDDARGARAILDRDARARGIEIVTPAAPDAGGEAPVVFIAGNCLVTARSVQAVADSVGETGGAGLRADGDAAFAIVAGPRVAWRGLWPLMTAQDPDQNSYWMAGLPPSRSEARLTVLDGSPGGSPCSVARAIRVRSTADIPRAEAALMTDLRAATIDTDGPIARVDRACSLRLSRWLVHTPLRPNHITVIGTGTGLLAAWALAQGSYAFGLLGAWLFWVAVIIDGCDGEVARLKFLESRFGQLFDVVTDNVVHIAIFAGLALGAHHADRLEHVFLFGATLITGFLCASAATYFCLLGDGPVKHLETTSRRGRIRQRVLRVFEALMNRDFAYLLVALALLDRLHWFLWGTVFGTYAYALGLAWVYRWSDEAAPRCGSADAAAEDAALR